VPQAIEFVEELLACASHQGRSAEVAHAFAAAERIVRLADDDDLMLRLVDTC
jgi:hypothetical protein